MKLATLNDGSRDGQLVVVSRDLAQAHFATGVATRLQQVLDDWNFLSPQLEDLYATLNGGKARHAFAFDPRLCRAPLPRAYQWLQAPAAPHDPLRLCQSASDDFLGPCDDAVFADAAGGIGFDGGLGVVTGDVDRGVAPAQALECIRLLVLVGAWRLHAPAAADLQPPAACAAVAVTPDELGAAWHGGRAHLALALRCNDRLTRDDAAVPAPPAHFGDLIAHAARARRLRAGSLLGSASGARAGGPGDAAQGPGGLAFGDRVQFEAVGADGQSVFGAIDQHVAPAAA